MMARTSSVGRAQREAADSSSAPGPGLEPGKDRDGDNMVGDEPNFRLPSCEGVIGTFVWVHSSDGGNLLVWESKPGAYLYSQNGPPEVIISLHLRIALTVILLFTTSLGGS